MSDAHSKYSASNQEAATLCPGKPVLEKGKPDSSSTYADEGTAAHALLADCLDGKTTPAQALAAGATYRVGTVDWPVTENMAEAVQTALDNIAEIAGQYGMVLSEQRVYYAGHLDVPRDEGWGTADVIAARDDELQVHDYKHGMGVEVDAGHDLTDATGQVIARRPNHQMGLYGLGALDQCQGVLGDFKTVRLVIHQPRIKSAPSEYVMTVDELLAWGRSTARSSVVTQRNAEALHPISVGNAASAKVWEDTFLRPGDKQCRFCKAASTCPALRTAVSTAVFSSDAASPDEFADMPEKVVDHVKASDDAWLDAAYTKLDVVETWMKAVMAEIERRLLAGGKLKQAKLVQGKQGNRAWADPAAAEAQLKAMRLKVEEMYDLKLISPTTAEKLVKAEVIGPRQWTKVQALITRAPGKPHVAPASDPRPALDLKPAVDDFESVKEDETTLDAFA